MSLTRPLALLLVFATLGCKDKDPTALPDDVPGLRQFAFDGRDATLIALIARDEDAAASAADRAEAAGARLRDMADAGDLDEEDQSMLEEVVAAAREARSTATLTYEMNERDRVLKGIEARTYRTARDATIGASIDVAALAAGQAEKQDLDSLPDPVRRAAERAERLAVHWTGYDPVPDAPPDWGAIRADLEALDTETSRQLATSVAVAHLLAGQSDLALLEMDRVRPTPGRLGEDQQRILVQSLIYISQGWQQLALREIGRLPSESDGAPDSRREFLAGIYLVSAYLCVSEGKLQQADSDLIEVMRIWPDNPVSVFLTGAHLAASGDYEAAADSLESLAEGTSNEAVAKTLAERARTLRDDPTAEVRLLIDTELLRALALESISQASDWEAATRLRRWMDEATAFASELKDR